MLKKVVAFAPLICEGGCMIDEEAEKRIHRIEKDALLGDRDAVAELINIRRKLHAALAGAWNRRYSGSTLDEAAATEMFDEARDAYEWIDD